MKGVILAGGKGARMLPLTRVTNKHLLPVYDKPMIYYPIQTLKSAGISDILIVSGRHHAGHFLELLGRGEELGLKLSYTIQEQEGGIAEALALARDFAGGDDITAILGDNIFEDEFEEEVSSFRGGARIFLKEVTDPERFGVAELDGQRVLNIEEKPQKPKSNFAVTGLYIYDRTVFDKIKRLKPSGRGELEITDVNNAYIEAGNMDARIVKGFWSDAGTFESLYTSSRFIRQKQQNEA
jgi:glucose-1-phosphate thymidylyltransferase